MNQRRYIAGLDVGSGNITLAVRVTDEEGRWLDEVYYARIPSRGVLNTVISNGLDVQDGIKQACAQLEKRLGFRVEGANLSFTGGEVQCALYEARIKCESKEKDTTYTIVSDPELQQIGKEIVKYSLSTTQLVFDKEPVRYLSDGREICGSAAGTYAEEFGCDYNLFIAQKENLTKLQLAVRHSGVSVQNVCLGMRAIGASVLTEKQCKEGVAILNVGHEHSELAFFENNRLQNYAWIGTGGAHVTSDLAKEFSLRFEEAERIKLSKVDLNNAGEEYGACILAPQSVEEKTVVGVVICRFYLLLLEVALFLRKWKVASLLSNNHGLVITGGGVALPGCDRFFTWVFHHSEVNIPLRVSYGTPLELALTACDETQLPGATTQLATAVGLIHLAARVNRVNVVSLEGSALADAAPQKVDGEVVEGRERLRQSRSEKAGPVETAGGEGGSLDGDETGESWVSRTVTKAASIFSRFFQDTRDEEFDDEGQ